ncbi:hypothetical protein QQ045_005162 [Rhodiola kirilowii]
MAEMQEGKVEPNLKVDKSGDGGLEVNYRKPDMVRFPQATQLVPPQLQLESEHSEKSDFVIWQVYAFGGYIILKWLWGKWKERQNQKGNTNE